MDAFFFLPLEGNISVSYISFVGRRRSGANVKFRLGRIGKPLTFVASVGGLKMRNFDLSPLMRSSVGFDHLSRLVDSALSNDSATAYPPYNIEKISEDDYQITMAIAGFSPEELSVTVQEGTLLIAGRAPDTKGERRFLHQGIAKRAFERRFQLAETIKVGDAHFENGLLQIELRRVIPEHKKPRNIEIRASASKVRSIEASAA